MTTINPEENILTLINTFTVEPENQEKLVGLLNEATEKVIKHLDGFVSVSIHQGVEGTKVANYAQWRSKEHFMAALKNPEAQAYMKQVEELVQKAEPVLYQVNSSHKIR